MKQLRILIGALTIASVLSVLSIASAFAAEPETTDGFICPVLGGQAGGDHGNSSPDPFVTISGGDTTIIGPGVNVPTDATNDDGAGTPGGDHASPGDDNYSPIWAL